MTGGGDQEAGSYASPACFMHEVDQDYMGLSDTADPRSPAAVKIWRKAERERLIRERLAIAGETRRRHAAKIAQTLEQLMGDVSGLIVSAYWPFRGEPDLRGLLERVVAHGGSTALPVVTAKARPLVFRQWSPGDPLERGVWNIPVPLQDAAVVVPDVVIAPVVGFDPACYRLGYGGGFFDRTLAAIGRTPRVFGVGFAQAAIPTIHPQPHDIPMDAVVTEEGAATRQPADPVRSAVGPRSGEAV